ncbi:MAG: hypothetical protein U1F60_14950 [Planctomycetota bacterium]
MPSSAARSAVPSLLVALLGGVELRAQVPEDPAPIADAIAAAERWLEDGGDRALDAERIVARLAVDRPATLAWLARLLPEAAKEPGTLRARAIHSLTTMVALDFVQSQRATDMVYAGQYAPLQPLMPFVGERFFELVLATPPWFAFTRRVHLVGPLRDLQPRAPSAERLEAVIRLVENEREDLVLRRQLSGALWQWGTKEFAQRTLTELQAETTEGAPQQRVHALLELADFHTLLREYRAAANTHLAAQALAKKTDVPLLPVAWYAAACAHGLAGDQKRGLEAFEQLAELLASPNLDPSHRIARKNLDADPELALLRKDPRFAAAMARAFPTDRVEAGEPRER